jgi:hypothetical protein
MKNKTYYMDARPTRVNGESGYWQGLVKEVGTNNSLYVTEPDFGSFPAAVMQRAEREYLEGLRFEDELAEGDTLRQFKTVG